MPTQQQLAKYARVLVHVGVNLQPGQRLRVNADIQAAPLVREITRAAYEAGSSLVTVHYTDEQLNRVRLDHAPDGTLEEFPEWTVQAALDGIERGEARLGLSGGDPDLLRGVDAQRVQTVTQTQARHMRPVSAATGNFEVAWANVAAPTPAWARRVLPDLPEDEALERLWDAVFHVARADTPDPVAAWAEHTRNLARRLAHLNERRYAALHFRAPGTDLTVGLADGHVWLGGSTTAKSGVQIVPNVPTDEVFTAPHRERVNGTVRATLPLSVSGTLIEGIEVRFEGGRVVHATARTGEAVLRRLIDTDEGAARLGEVALVPASAPVARTGLLYYNTLLDENAASHIALGRAYPTSVGGDFSANGGNDSLIHVDWMIGSAEMNVDGLLGDGTREPLMRGGEWVID